ncbi:MAG: GerAB/ArcD/ProY family transporter [Bacillota bacterium]|uniref:GerAB/ArcD/ProY family transporter n=1 Tax=Desulfurispora thermophila TaxID=265470 RepID=UPI000361DB1D|nr:endospore germination permease [Desulfurispora thermophila]
MAGKDQAQNNQNNAVTISQLALTITAVQIGTGIAVLPRQLAKSAGHDGWLSALGGGLLFIILGLLMFWLAARFPNQGLFGYLPRILGKPLSLLIIAYLVVSFSGALVVGTRSYIDVVQLWSLPRTPRWLLASLTLLPGLYLAWFGLQAIARMAELFGFLLVLATFMIISPWPDINWGNLLPVGDAGWKNIALGVLQTKYAYNGILIFLLLFPTLKPADRSRAVKAIVAGLLITTAVYVLITVITTGVFSIEALQSELYPVMTLISLTKLEIVQRIEIIFLYLNLITVITTQAPFAYLVTAGLQQLTGMDKKKFLLPVGLITAFLAAYPLDIFLFDTYSEFVAYAIFIAEAVLVPLLLITAIIRKQKEQ